MQREVRIYQQLQPLQGVHVPHLLGYGVCDEWQYFLVRRCGCLSGATIFPRGFSRNRESEAWRPRGLEK